MGADALEAFLIIPYQVITGNYNVSHCYRDDDNIIPYQVITGNYNSKGANDDD